MRRINIVHVIREITNLLWAATSPARYPCKGAYILIPSLSLPCSLPWDLYVVLYVICVMVKHIIVIELFAVYKGKWHAIANNSTALQL